MAWAPSSRTTRARAGRSRISWRVCSPELLLLLLPQPLLRCCGVVDKHRKCLAAGWDSGHARVRGEALNLCGLLREDLFVERVKVSPHRVKARHSPQRFQQVQDLDNRREQVSDGVRVLGDCFLWVGVMLYLVRGCAVQEGKQARGRALALLSGRCCRSHVLRGLPLRVQSKLTQHQRLEVATVVPKGLLAGRHERLPHNVAAPLHDLRACIIRLAKQGRATEDSFMLLMATCRQGCVYLSMILTLSEWKETSLSKDPPCSRAAWAREGVW